MNINDKIEEIRQKPEHIRMRYVWGSVFVVMILILIVWFFSIKETFKENPNKNNNKQSTQRQLDQKGIKKSLIEEFMSESAPKK